MIGLAKQGWGLDEKMKRPTMKLGIAAIGVGVVVAILVWAFTPSLAGTYTDEGLTKHPRVLTLESDGTYLLASKVSGQPIDAGRWWPVGDQVALLLPDDLSKRHRFARIKDTFILISEDLRIALGPGIADALERHDAQQAASPSVSRPPSIQPPDPGQE